MADKGKRKDNSQQPDEYYPTPATIPAGTRCLTLEIPDSAEWYGMALGALWELMRIQNYEKVGIDIDLTVDRWLEVFRTMEVTCMDIIPVGATMIWHHNAPPERWLLCTGGAAYVAEYPKLFELWGYKYGGAGAQFGLPDIEDFSPMGAGGLVGLDDYAGDDQITLTVGQMPAHSHRVPKQSATVNAAVNVATPAARTDNAAAPHITTDPTGGNEPHDNLSPVFGVHFIVYGGRA